MKNFSVLFVLSLLSTASFLNAGGFNANDATLEDIDGKLAKLSRRVVSPGSELAGIIEYQKDALKALRESNEKENLQGIEIATKAYNALKNERDALKAKQSQEALN
ncbi:MAG TPA: hypothetical protein VMW10_03490, partial [Alphaproteobacteria bacterium]|nr:hypothetical protein [Alphaproteobacteria bacterium]